MIANLKPYPAYQESGVPWLGDVPDHWNVRRQRNVVQMLVSTVDKHTIEGEIPVRLCNYVDVYKNDRITDQIAFMRASASQAEVERFRLRRGDVVITKDSESWNDIGVPVLVEYEAPDLVCGYHLAILRPHNQVSTGGYLFRALQSQGVAVQYHVSANGVTRYGLSHDAIKSVILPIPPLPEQTAIARFLDHVDWRIRRYVRAKRKLIGLLEEQKQAIIHRAVTRGLDPEVPLKPSGVPWLGDVPDHWNVRRQRNVGQMLVSTVDKHIIEGEIPVRLCNYVDVYKNDHITDQIAFMRASASQAEVERFRLRRGDVVITKDSESWNDIGVPALVEYEAPDLVCGYHLAILRPHNQVSTSGYLFRALQSQGVAVQYHVSANGVTRYGLSHDAIKSVILPIPPLAEQAVIVHFLDEARANLDRATAAAQCQIDLIREYRTRLIADVVTGKLDVREAAAALPKEPDEPEPLHEADALCDADEETEMVEE